MLPDRLWIWRDFAHFSKKIKIHVTERNAEVEGHHLPVARQLTVGAPPPG